jgi:hypothetical protein
MTIKEGYDGKKTTIRIQAHAAKPQRIAEVWIEQLGLVKETHRFETLAYATLDELLALRDECNEAIQRLVGTDI